MKACDRYKRDKLFEILQSEYSPNLLLKTKEIYSGNKIKINFHYPINHGIRQG